MAKEERIPLPKDFEGLYFVQPKDRSKTLPDGSQITLGTDKKEKIAVFYQSSQYTKGKVYVHNLKTGKVFVDGAEGSTEDLKKMKHLIDYFNQNMKESDCETLMLPTKEKEG